MPADVTFPEFFTAVHGHEPFPWQTALAERLLAGDAVEVIDIPTGLGKTAVIDVFVWLAAVTGCAPETLGRRRTFFVIDRRIVVDDAFQHAQRIAEALGEGRGPCEPVARALRQLAEGSPDEPALVVERMRGGITRDWRWLDRPDRAAVIVSTVDQLGSRLLFRGYGLRPELAPIDAALVGTDSTIIIDEAHLSTPLIETLRQVRTLDRPAQPLGTAVPVVLQMSATTGRRTTERVHTIGTADEEHPVARTRLDGAKRMQLVEMRGSGPARATRVVDVLADLALQFVADTGDGAVGVVCNTVGRARAVFDRLRSSRPAPEVLLLTGRVRGWDRRRIETQARQLAGFGRDRGSTSPCILVATQTIEVGANLDFDALVTESASWDALVQRFGRLNRAGARDGAAAVVVHDGLPSPTYGSARDETWEWLCSLPGASPVQTRGKPPTFTDPGVAISPRQLRALTDGAPLDRIVVEPGAEPALLAAHLDAWTQTSPQPVTSPPVAPFLHGYGRPNDEIHLVWRSDLPWIEGARDELRELWSETVDAVPPSADERLTVPLSSFRRWVRGAGAAAAADVDDLSGAGPDDTDEREPPAVRGPVLRWRGPDDAELLELPRDLYRVRPDDTLVLPSAFGGCDEFGWVPASRAPVPDLADVAARVPTLRLLPKATLAQTLGIVVREGPELTLPEDFVDDLTRRCTEAWQDDDTVTLREMSTELWNALPVEALRALGWSDVEPSPQVSFGDPRRGPAAVARFGPRSNRIDRRFTSDVGADPASTSIAATPVTLEAHQAAVAARARSIGANLGLPSEVVEAVVGAAAWHDVGKIDPRFQVMLHGGDDAAAEIALEEHAPLAKSGMDPANRGLLRRAFLASGLPSGFRHEVGSASAVAQYLDATETRVDRELVRHLVGAHHGRGRPLFPPVRDDGQTVQCRWAGIDIEIEPSRSIDWDGPRRFAALNRRYGRWGLALLETIVRLADIGCSEEGT